MTLMDARILIVDDDESLRDMLAMALDARGYGATTAASGEAALERLVDDTFDAVITDLHMPGMDGLELGRRIIENRDVPVILLTGEGTIEAAIGAVRAGVDDFLRKPVEIEQLILVLERAIENRSLRRELKRLRDAVGDIQPFEDMVGRSAPMKTLQDLVTRVAPADVSVLITGESGTGKELVARAMHERSPRAPGAFIAINCAAMPAALLESELFGHAKGAFTDAKADKMGLLRQASGGTIFLDEIGDMPMEMQAKLLRALQEKRARPVGGTDEIEFDARILAATNRDLEEDIEDGRFREDLYYRINVVHVPVPPLRARGDDVLLLAQHFVHRAAERAQRSVRGISPAVAERLRVYEWPGNVRELENAMERAVALAKFDEITPEDLPRKIASYESPTVEPRDDAAELPTVEELERRHIARVLKATDGNKTRAAKILGFDRRTLYRKLERYGIDG